VARHRGGDRPHHVCWERPRRVRVGEPGDLCLLRGHLRDVLADAGADAVAGTVIDGAVVGG
jgi:hypothetical protein